MPYDPQDFSVGQVLTADQMDQVEENIRDHVHGAQGISNWVVAIDSGGSGNAYTVTLSPSPGAYVNGLTIFFKASHTNTGAATMNVNGMGAVSIRKFGGTALASGNLVSGTWHIIICDGTNFQLVSQLSSGVTVADLSKAQGSAGVSTDTVFAVNQYAFASPSWSGSTGEGVIRIGNGSGGRAWRAQSQGASTVTWDYLL